MSDRDNHVLIALWRLIQPCAWVLIGAQAAFGVLIMLGAPPSGLTLILVKGFWFGSPVPAPGISLLDALIYFWAGYRACRRTGSIGTGMLAAAATSFIGLSALFTVIAFRTPELLAALVSKPFIFVIIATMGGMALCCGVVAGAIGGLVGKQVAAHRPSLIVSLF